MGKLYIKDKAGKFQGSVSDGKTVPSANPKLPKRPQAATASAPKRSTPYPSVVLPKDSFPPPKKGEEFQDWVEKIYQSAWKGNRNITLRNLKSYTLEELREREPQLVERLESHAKKYGYTLNQVHKEASRNKLFGETFAPDPTKQRIHEKLAFQHIGQYDNVESLIQPPASGPNSVVIHKPTGELMTRGQLEERGLNKKDATKSVDFVWVSHGTMFVASHKYIKEAGGGQLHQRDDLVSFVDSAPDKIQHVKPSSILYHHGEDDAPMPVKFIGFADGPYFDEDAAGGGTKRQKLKKQVAGTHKHVIKMEELPALIENVGRKQKQSKSLFN